jgi:GNAT superfamily N-acetyltransferase
MLKFAAKTASHPKWSLVLRQKYSNKCFQINPMLNWRPTLLPDSLVCRPALARDKPGMLALTAQIWDGHDYVPQVWDDWLLDSVGRLMVAEMQGRIVGLGKLTCLALDQWWVEGLRVHPDLQGRSIASHMHAYLLRTWEQIGSGVLRLATSAKRLPIHHLCYRTGFKQVAEFSAFRAPALNEPVDRFSPVAEAQLDQALQQVVASPSLALSAGLWDLGWEWAAPTQAFIAQAVGMELAFWWRKDRGLLVLRIDKDEDDPLSPAPFVQVLACSLVDLPELLQDYRRLAAELGYRQAGWTAALDPRLQKTLQAAGFERTWDSSVYIFEKFSHSEGE